MRNILGFGLLGLVWATPSYSHNEWGVMNDKISYDKEVTTSELEQLAQKQIDPDARYVMERAVLWTPGSILSVCFIGGSADQRNAVFEATKVLLQKTQINISMEFSGFRDCKKGQNGVYSEDVRIKLDGGCCSAAVGRYSHSPKTSQGSSVDLGGNPAQYQILHELIHALGFHHEHQKPNQPCVFDYEAIQKRFGWSIQEVKANFDTLPNSNRYIYSNAYDTKSIMKYEFSEGFVTSGPQECSTEYSAATELSEDDWSGLRAAYPMGINAALYKGRVSKGRAALSLDGVPPELINLIQSEN